MSQFEIVFSKISFINTFYFLHILNSFFIILSSHTIVYISNTRKTLTTLPTPLPKLAFKYLNRLLIIINAFLYFSFFFINKTSMMVYICQLNSFISQQVNDNFFPFFCILFCFQKLLLFGQYYCNIQQFFARLITVFTIMLLINIKGILIILNSFI